MAFVLLAASPQSQASSVLVPVHQLFDGLNKNDAQTTVAACASPASVVDEFPPHEWQGATACADWLKGLTALDKQLGITDTVATLGKPLHVDVTGDRAYVVVPATYSYKMRGKTATESALFTAALRNFGGSWRITGWAWAKR